MPTQNIPVVFTGTVAADVGVVVNTSGVVTVGITAGNPNEVVKLLTILDAARQVVVDSFGDSNPSIVRKALRGATGF